MNSTLTTILDLLTTQGVARYGQEAISQLDHALQCATLAEDAGQSAEMIAACLLHDVGHLVHHLGEDAALRGLDDRHEYCAMSLLQSRFGPAVTEPIRLHVEAKRYLCAIDPDYWDLLSPASRRSLELQGSRFSAAAAAAFIQQPYAKEAVQLRRWDDQAKVIDRVTPPIGHFVEALERCL